jgi:hypothetical protein
MYCIFHYVTLNGFDNNVIICWYIIFYELFVLKFIIKMYYVKKNHILKNSFVWMKYEENNDGLKKNVLKTS